MKILSWYSPMTRWFMANIPCSARCRERTTRPRLTTCGPPTVICTVIPAKSFCSWARNLPRCPNGTRMKNCPGAFWSTRSTRLPRNMLRLLISCIGPSRLYPRRISILTDSSGSTAP